MFPSFGLHLSMWSSSGKTAGVRERVPNTGSGQADHHPDGSLSAPFISSQGPFKVFYTLCRSQPCLNQSLPNLAFPLWSERYLIWHSSSSPAFSGLLLLWPPPHPLSWSITASNNLQKERINLLSPRFTFYSFLIFCNPDSLYFSLNSTFVIS